MNNDPRKTFKNLEYCITRDHSLINIELTHAHRSGISTNMTIGQFNKAVFDKENNTYRIKIWEHKTVETNGPAVLNLTTELFRDIENFVTIASNKISDISCENVFISTRGNAMKSD